MDFNNFTYLERE